jgi:hypothetical protein
MSERELPAYYHNWCLGARSGAKIRHGLLTYRRMKEICNATGELARVSARFFSIVPDLFIAGDEPHETNSPASGVATGIRGRAGRRLTGSRSTR